MLVSTSQSGLLATRAATYRLGLLHACHQCAYKNTFVTANRNLIPQNI